MNSNQIKEIAIKYGTNNKQQFTQTLTSLLKLPPNEIITILFDCFYMDFQAQEFAGKLLLQIRPKCEDNVILKVKDLLNSWDLSVEQLPWYLAEIFGVSSAITLLKTIKENELNNKERKALETMIWWINGFKGDKNSKYEIPQILKCIEIVNQYKVLTKNEDLYDDLLIVMRNRKRWSETRFIFERIRKEVTLKCKDNNMSLDYLFAQMAENCAKTTYNFSGSSAPYDKNSFSRLIEEEQIFIQLFEKKSG